MKHLPYLVFVFCVLFAGTGLASEQSERLYARGLVDFHADRYTDALQHFDQAVQADPQDVYALYYRGMTHGRLGDYAAAAADLRAALAKKPDLQQAPLELGVALVQAGAFRDAIPWLEQAQRNRDTDAQASLFLGIAQLRLGETEPARAHLIRAAAADPSLEVSARYYQGVADYRDGKLASAETHFSYVASTSPASDMGHEAAAFLTRLRAAGPRRRYYLYGMAGFQYDSNVVLAPSNEAIKNLLGISKQADGRAVLEAGGTYAPWRSEHTELTIGYEFYQSLHFRLDQFNLQDHRPSAQFVVTSGPFQFGILGRYDYYFLRADSFLQEATALPWITISEGPAGRTEIFYRMRRRDFLKRPFSGQLDSFNHAPGIRQYFYLGAPERYVALGYRFDREDPINQSGNQFAYDGQEVDTGFGWVFPARVSADLEYAYRHESYAPPSAQPAGTEQRRDDEHQAVAAVHLELSDHVRVTAAYLATFNNSNKLLFDYDRHVGSVTLEVRY
jgi:tetratricopeptide (TPR) repeat protein